MTARDPAPELAAAQAQAAADLARRAGELARLEALASGWEPGQQALLSALKTGIEELNAEAFRRLIRALQAEPAAAAALRQAVQDPLVYQVLRFHGLVKESLDSRVRRALDEVRPQLQAHGGDVELVALQLPGTVQLRLSGSCQTCPSSGETLSEGVERAIRALCPEIHTVERVGRGAPQGGAGLGEGTQPLHFISPFARAPDEGWIDLCALDELADGTLQRRQLGGRDLLLVRQGLQVSCLDNACAHMGLPLDGGQLDQGRLRCPHHGFVYALDSGECLTVPEVQLALHAVRVVGQRVAVRLRR